MNRTRNRAARTFYQASRMALIAVVVGSATATGGMLLALGGLVAAVVRSVRIGRDHRDQLAARRKIAARQARWDADWERWGGRLPTRRP